MPNDTVKIKFDVQDVDGSKQKFAQMDAALKEIESSVKRLNGVLTSAARTELFSQDLPALKRTVKDMHDLETATHQAERAVVQLNREMAKQNAQGFAGRPGAFSGQGSLAGGFEQQSRGLFSDITRGGGGAGGTRDLLDRFNNAKKEVDGLATSTKKLGGEMTRVHGIAEIGASLFAQVGVRGGESISLLIRQFSEMGLTVDKLFTNRAFLTIMGIAGAAGLAMVTQELKQMNIEMLKFTEHQANFGLVGSQRKQQGEIEALKEILDSIDQTRRRFGNADEPGIIGRAFGKPDPTVFQTTKNFVDSFLSLVSGADKEVTKKFNPLGLFIQDPVQLLNSRKEVARQLEEAEKDSIRATDEHQLKLLDNGNRTNIFDTARRSVQELAKEVGALGEVDTFIKNAIQNAGGGTLDPKTFDLNLTLLQEKLQKQAETQRSIISARKDVLEEERQIELKQGERNAQNTDARRQVQSLQLGIEDNPLAKLFFDAQTRMIQFQKQFPSVRQQVLDDFQKMNDGVLNLELFKTGLSEKLGLRKLEGDIARLQAAGSFSDRDISNSENSRLAQARVKQAQFFGSLEDVRSAQAGLLGRGAELEAQARQAHFNGQFVREAELQNEAERFNRTERGRLTEQDIKQREILALKSELGGTNDPQKQRFVLDKLLEVTSNIGELSGEDRELRLKSLQQRLALGEARTVVRIDINNNAGDAATVTQDSLGPEPSPGFGNGFFGRGFNAAAESSGVAFGASDPNNRIGN